MSGGRGKCRAIREPGPGGCRANEDALVLLKVPSETHPGNYTFTRIGLCKHHTQLWLNHLANPELPPVRYKPHLPPVTAELP